MQDVTTDRTKKSRFYSAKNPVNFQANKTSFLFQGRVQFENTMDKNHKSIDTNQKRL